MTLKIRTKIYGGFALILSLIVIVSVIGVWGLFDGKQALSTYGDKTDLSLAAGEIDTNLSDALRFANAFAASKDAKYAGSFKDNLSEVGTSLDRLQHDLTGTGKDMIAEAKVVHGDLDGTFARLVVESDEESRLISTAVNQLGADIRRNLSQAVQVYKKGGDLAATIEAAEHSEKFLLIRVLVARYVAEHSPEDLKRIRQDLANLTKGLTESTGRDGSSEAGLIMAKAGAALPAYLDGIEKIVIVSGKRDGSLSSVLDLGEKLSDKVGKVREFVMAQKNEVAGEAGRTADKTMTLMVAASFLALFAGVLFAVLIARSTAKPILSMVSAMKTLAGGDTSVNIPGAGKQDEIGDMADAVQIFRDTMVRTREMEAETKAQEQRTKEHQREAMLEMADSFERSVGGLVQAIDTAAVQLESSAGVMSQTSRRTGEQSNAVAAAATQTSMNVQTVSAACEQLTASVTDISRQVVVSTRAAQNAVDSAERTGKTVEDLSDAARRIGDIVKLISDIASQTNLLALNATIEAARAGDAGKGFAVVASEVKQLATQTARATDEISQQIQGIQGVSSETIAAIRDISRAISDNRDIAVNIASAVEEQGAATNEIARNIQQTAAGTQEVSQAIAEVSTAAGEGGIAAAEVLASARDLAETAARLKAGVQDFLSNVRAS